MPNLESFSDFIDDLVELFEDAADWASVIGNELVLGALVGLALIYWIWKGRETPVRPA